MHPPNKTKQQQNTTQPNTTQHKKKEKKDNKQTLYWPQAVDLCDDVRRG